MNILVIISQYLPAQTPNTLRWAPLIEAMKEKGHRVSVLTTKRRGQPDREESDGVAIYRTGYNTLLDRLYDLFNSKSRRNETGASASAPGLLTTLIQRMVDKTWRNRYWPDGSKLFLKPGVKLAKLLAQQQNIDRVISVGLPFTSHLIGQSVKEAYPEIHWHMDIQDPFCYSKEFWVNNFERYTDKNISAEGIAFALCNSATVTNEVAKAKYAELFPEQASKLKVTSPLFALPDIDENDSSKFYHMRLYARKIHLTYAGSFYRGVRSIEPFLKFLEYMFDKEPVLYDELQFHFLGQLDAGTMKTIEAHPKVRRWFVIHGFKNRNQTMAALQQTDLIMNFGNTTDYHLPSKVVDYLYLNKPVVNFVSIDNDSSKSFLADKTVPSLNVNLSLEDFEKSMSVFKKFVSKAKSQPTQSDEGAITDYQPSKLVEAYLS